MAERTEGQYNMGREMEVDGNSIQHIAQDVFPESRAGLGHLDRLVSL